MRLTACKIICLLLLATSARAFDATPLMSFFGASEVQYGNELDETHPLPTVWNSTLISKWSLNTNAVDSKGANNLAWSYGSSAYSNGIAGTMCGWYGGASSAKKDTPSGMPAANAAFTVSLWIKAASTTSQIGFFGIGAPGYRLLGMLIYQHKLQVTDSVAANFFGNTVLDDGNWHHVVAIWYGTSSGPLSCFIDGNVETGSGAPTDVTANGISQISVGAFQNNQNFFVGHIDDVALWNVALTTQQVLSVWNSAKQPWR